MKILRYRFGNLFPTELEAITDDGKFIYARYRGGRFRYGVGKTMSEADDNCLKEKGSMRGDQYEGSATLEQFKQWAPELNFSEAIDVGWEEFCLK